MFLAMTSPEEGLETSPFKTFQFLLDSEISVRPTAAVIARLVRTCLTQVSRAGISQRFLMLPSPRR